MAGIDINRTTTGVVLPSELSGEIWQQTQEASAVMGLSNNITLPGSGLTFDIITGDPTPDWVAQETDEKEVSTGTVSSKKMQGYTLAVIVPFSNQFRRDKSALYNAFVQRLPGALAKKIDETIFFGTAPGSNFDALTSATAVSLVPTDTTVDAYDQLIDAEVDIAEAGYSLNGYAISARGVGLLRKVRDANGIPLLGSLSGFDTLMGVPVRRTQAVQKVTPGQPDLIGVAGDWSTATFGVVENIMISVSDQATLTDGGTTVNLWQRNMFAVRAEMEVGFVVRDVDAFRRLTGATTPAS